MREAEIAKAALERLRNSLGGHVRPQSASEDGTCAVQAFLQNIPNFKGQIVVGEPDLRLNHFNGLTAPAFLMAWPGTDSDDKLADTMRSTRDLIVRVVPDLLHTLDTLIVRHMLALGLISLPPDFELAALTRKGTYKSVRGS